MSKYQFHIGDYIKLNGRHGRIMSYCHPTDTQIDKSYRLGIEFDGFNRPVDLYIDEEDIALLFDSIGKYDFYRKQDMDEFIWKQRVLKCGEEMSMLIEEGKKYR